MSLPSPAGPCDVMSGSVASLYDPIRVPFRTCAREGKHISHKIWIRMCPIGKTRMHCVVCKSCCYGISILYSGDILCSAERSEFFHFFVFFIFKARVLLLPRRWRQQFTPKRRYPRIKLLDVITRKVCLLDEKY